MSEKKRTSVKFITPRGVAIYPKLQKPDTKFKPEGQYTCKLRIESLPEDISEKITALRDAFLAETIEGIKAGTIGPKWNAKERAAKLKELQTPDIITNEVDKEGEETGFVLINAKMTASGVSKKDGKPWTRSPTVFDSKGKKISPVPAIFGGSELKLAVEAATYFAPGTKTAPPAVGVTYYLEAVQVLKLVKAGDKSAEGYGFGEEEGGYEDAADEGGEQFNAAAAADDAAGADAPASGSDF